MSERAHLGQSPFRSYGSTSIDPSPSLPSSVFSSTADSRSKQLPRSTEYEPTTRAIDSGFHHDYDARQGPVSFPKRIARKLHNWIGESGITCDFRLPRRWIRADKEEGANGIAEGQYERERLSAGSARGALDEGEGGEVEPDDDWWSDRLGQEGLILPLLIITFSCALADAGTLIHFSTFATSMTGNTVLVAVALMKATNKSPLYAAVSLIGFIGTGLVTGQLGAAYGNRSRSWLMSSMIFQIVILILALGMVSPHGPVDVGHDLDWVYVLFIGIQGGAQVTMAANSGARELPTAMMTTPYAAFVSDPTLFRSGSGRDVRARNRRFIYILTFWVGSFLGAAIARWSTLWVMTAVVLGCKGVVAVMIAFTRGEKPESETLSRPKSRSRVWQDGGTSDALHCPYKADQDGADEDEEDAERRSIYEQQRQHSLRVKRRRSSMFERLQDQEPRDERDVAF